MIYNLGRVGTMTMSIPQETAHDDQWRGRRTDWETVFLLHIHYTVEVCDLCATLA
jgi:hypothetical protein